MPFTFTQPITDHTEQPAPAESIVSAVNYDRSPSLVDLSSQPSTPIAPHEFTSFAEAQSAYNDFLPGCNWGKPPTLKRFWYESEKHLTPGVDFVSWGFREHPHWVAANNGEILERTEDNEELASHGIGHWTDKGPVSVGRAVALEAMAALDRSAKIAEGLETMPAATNEVEAIQSGLATLNEVLQASHNQVVEAAAEAIASGVIASIETTDGQETITTTINQPGEGTPTTEPTTEPAAAPTVRLKYTEAEYADLRRLAEENHAIELTRKENQYAEISMERAKAEDKVKALKAEEKGQLESLRFMKSEGPKYPKNPEVTVGPTTDGAVTNQEGGSSDAATVATTTSEHDVSDERYQRYCALPLLPIVKDIKGLGTKKLQTLIDQFPTVGELLEMQKRQGLQWCKAIGRGFGEELGSRIENAVGDALAKVE